MLYTVMNSSNVSFIHSYIRPPNYLTIVKTYVDRLVEHGILADSSLATGHMIHTIQLQHREFQCSLLSILISIFIVIPIFKGLSISLLYFKTLIRRVFSRGPLWAPSVHFLPEFSARMN